MDIAFFGYENGRRDALEANTYICLGRDTPVWITQHEISRQHMILTQPEPPCAVFIIIDDANALHGDIPIIIVSDSAEYSVWSWRPGTSRLCHHIKSGGNKYEPHKNNAA